MAHGDRTLPLIVMVVNTKAKEGEKSKNLIGVLLVAGDVKCIHKALEFFTSKLTSVSRVKKQRRDQGGTVALTGQGDAGVVAIETGNVVEDKAERVLHVAQSVVAGRRGIPGAEKSCTAKSTRSINICLSIR